MVDAFLRNNGRYNLLDSAILELFEFIQNKDIKPLCDYVVYTFGKALDEVEYVQTFKRLRLRYGQEQDRTSEVKEQTASSPVSPSTLKKVYLSYYLFIFKESVPNMILLSRLWLIRN